MATSAIGRLSAILELDSARFQKGMDKAQKRLSRFRKRIDRAGKDMAVNMARVGGIAAVAGTGLAIKQFADFEEQLIAVGKVTDMEGKRLDKFGKKVMDLGQTVPVANKELLAIAESAGRLGVEGEEALLAFTETVGKLGTATDLAGEQAATTLARLLNVTGEAAESVGTLGSVLVRLGNNVAATESEIAEMATRIAQSTQRFGTSSAEAAAFGAVLAEMGFKAELAGTAMGRTFEAINKAVSSGGDALRTLEKVMGRTGEQIRTAFREDTVQSVRDFAQAIGDLPASEQVKALEALGLSGQRVIQIITTLGSQTEAVNKVFRLANEELSNTQALNLEAAKAAESFKSQMRFLGNALNEVGVAVGRALAPKIVELGNKFRRFIEEAQKTGQLERIVRDIATAFNGVVTVIQHAVQFAATMADRLKTINAFVRDLLGMTKQTQIGKMKKELDLLIASQERLQAIVDNAERSGGMWDNAIASGTKFFNNMEQVRAELKRVNEEIRNKIRRISELSRESDNAGVQIGDLGLQTKMLGDNSAIAAERLKDMGDGASGAANDTDKLGDSIKTDNELMGEFQNKLMALNRMYQQGKISLTRYDNEVQSLSGSMSILVKEQEEAASTAFGMGKALNEALGDMRNALEKHKQDQRQIWDNLIDGVQGAWVTFFEDTLHGKGLKSVKDFLGSVKDLFFRLIAQIAAKWTAAKIFGGSFSMPSISFGEGGGIGGLANVGKSIASGVSKLFGGGAIEAGTGATAGGFSLSGLGSIAGPAAFLSTPFVLDEIFNKPGPGAIARKNFAQGRGMPGPAGMQLTKAQGEIFAGGPFAGAAGEFARGRGVEAGRGGGGIASLGRDLEQAKKILADFEKELEGFKRTAAKVFQSSGRSASEMGQIIKDGVVNRVELASLGLENFGSKVEMGRDGVIKLGDVSSESFRQITNAVRDGELRLAALRGEVTLTQGEMRLLENAGLAVSQTLGEAGRVGAESLRELQGAANEAAGAFRDAAGAAASIGGIDTSVGEAQRDSGLTQQLRDDARRGGPRPGSNFVGNK